METCSNCGAVARPGAKFCTTCGSRLTASEAPAAAGGWQQPSQTVDQGPETAPDVVVVSAPRQAGETETGTAASNAETGVAAEPQGASSSASSWTWGSSTEEEPDTREDSGSGVGASSDADAQVETTAATNVTAVGDSVPVAWSWNAHAADAGSDEVITQDNDAAETGDTEDVGTVKRSAQSMSDTVLADELSGSSKPWSWGASEAEPASNSASRTDDASSSQSATGNDVSSASSGRADSSSFESTQAPNAPVDIDVSSAFNDPNDGDETLSSWAARWNETETESEESSKESTGESDTSSPQDADIDFTQRSPLEGAPGGELAADDVTKTETDPAIDYAIEGAPGGQVQVTETKDGDEAAAPAADDTALDAGIEGAPGRYEERDQTSDAGIEGAPGGYAQDPADDVADDVASETTFEDAVTSADQDDEVARDQSEEPTGAFGTEVTPGTDSDLVDPLVGMEVTPVAATPPVAVESFERTAFETDAAPDSSANGSLATSARERAEQLIDELRGLIPSIAGSEASPTEPETVTAGGPVVQPTIDELEAARPSAGQFDELRTALENARSNRRDVDTMLDLVGRVDDLISLLDAQDRLDGAVGHAIGQLKGDVTSSDDA